MRLHRNISSDAVTPSQQQRPLSSTAVGCGRSMSLDALPIAHKKAPTAFISAVGACRRACRRAIAYLLSLCANICPITPVNIAPSTVAVSLSIVLSISISSSVNLIVICL
tara:strand:- start:351 stop:680 length:330 start_codon:yes stop_codon:yes gene_type:complete